MRDLKIQKVLIIFSVWVFSILYITPIFARSAVDIDYPNHYWFTEWYEDEKLPGEPSVNIEEYKQELLNWAVDAGLSTINMEMINEIINLPFTANQDESLLFQNAGTSEVIFDNTKPLWHVMRDLIFVEILQYRDLCTSAH